MSQRANVSLATLVLVVSCAPPPRTLVIEADAVVPGDGTPPTSSSRLRTSDGAIVQIEIDASPLEALPADARRIDARGSTLRPGRIAAAINPDAASSLWRAPAWAADQLRAGTTAVALLGTELDGALALQRYVGTARSRGPRLFISGPALTASEMPERSSMAQRTLLSIPDAVVAVQELVEAGVDVAFVTPPTPTSAAIACAAVAEARRQELRIVTTDATASRWPCPDGLRPAQICLPGATPADCQGAPGVDGASRQNARALGLADALGVVRVGYRADCVAAATDAPRRVIVDGVLQDLGPPHFYAPLLLALAYLGI